MSNLTAEQLQALKLTQIWAKSSLTNANKAFTKNPNATNWDVCLRAMFAHQQIDVAVRSRTVDRAKLVHDLVACPVGDWQNIICRATLGMDIRQCLRDFACN